MKRGYKGDTKIKMLDGIIFKKKFQLYIKKKKYKNIEWIREETPPFI